MRARVELTSDVAPRPLVVRYQDDESHVLHPGCPRHWSPHRGSWDGPLDRRLSGAPPHHPRRLRCLPASAPERRLGARADEGDAVP
jgi:hypothetical protein